VVEIARAAAANLIGLDMSEKELPKKLTAQKEQEWLKELRKMIGEDIEGLRELICKFRQKLH
jgi:nitrate/nitrite-specific signal transduction histidine kinase